MADEGGPVVVGVDGSDQAVSATRWAAAIASKLNAPLHIVHAEPPSGHNFSDTIAAIRAAEMSALQEAGPAILEAAERAAGAHNSDLPITSTQRPDPVDEALVDLSRQARMIVLGCGDVSVGAALLVGSTTVAVASHAMCPVVAWRGDVVTPTDRPIAVGVGGDDDSKVAIGAAFELAERLNVGVVAVHAWSTRRPPSEVAIPLFIDWDAVAADERKNLMEALAPWRRRYPGVDVNAVVKREKPSDVLLRHSGDAQLVVVGSRGRGLISGTLLGSTGLNLLHHSPIPTMICRSQGAVR
ncbi:universal stress protein [Mycobacterium sp. IDR2000157661]|uniref:universal stress protein n=1 Tax=Mycobacterium sp. IDR2000157661 TaxID=2867005 RepID=UPI001EECB10A|nr:universal stress protein [Mycobacterium sp. IDR2000157661]ULE33422.1 universal stress protein [Mycobacterium sp. IDR2000157661]